MNQYDATKGASSPQNRALLKQIVKAAGQPRPKSKVPKRPAQQAFRRKNGPGNSLYSAPVASQRNVVASAPLQRSLPGGDMIVSHREYLQDVNGSVAFTANKVSINPGLPSSFPWLNGIAQRFESYKFDKLDFVFETEAATSTTGALILGVDYDASDAAPTSKTQVMAFRSSVRSAPWASCKLSCALEDLRKRQSFFVRNGSNPAGTDVKLYDVGSLFICTQNQAGTTAIGELYIDYTIRLMTPVLNPVGLGEAVYGEFSGSSNAAPAGTTESSNLPATLVSSGTTTSVNTWTFNQPWSGICTVLVQGTGLSGSGSVTFTGTATEATNFGVTFSTTAGMNYCEISAQIGQTFVATIANSTISSANWYFGQGNFS